MKKSLLGLLALTTVANFASGYVKNDYTGTLKNEKLAKKPASSNGTQGDSGAPSGGSGAASASDPAPSPAPAAAYATELGAKNETNVGVFFGPKNEAFAFSGLTLKGEKLFSENYVNKAPDYYLGGSMDTNLTEKVDLSAFFGYKTDKTDKERFEKKLKEHQVKRGTNKETEKLGYFGEENKTVLLGLGLEERLGKTTLNQSIGFSTDDELSVADITTKFEGVTKFNEMSTLSGFAKHKIDLRKQPTYYGEASSEIKHVYKKDKLEAENAIKFETPRLIQIAKVQKDKKGYERDEEAKTLKSKHLYNFTLGSENKVKYMMSDNTTLTGVANYQVESKKFDEGTDKLQSLVHSPKLGLDVEYKKDKMEAKSLNSLEAVVTVVDYKEAGEKNDVTVRDFDFEKYVLTGKTFNEAKKGNFIGLLDFITVVDTKNGEQKNPKMFNHLRAGLKFDNSKSEAGLGYSFGTDLKLKKENDGRVMPKVEEATYDEHILFFYTHNNFEKKLNDVLTFKGAYDLSTHGSLDNDRTNYSFGFATRAMAKLVAEKGKAKFTTSLTGKHYSLLNNKTLGEIKSASGLKGKYEKFNENQMASVKFENNLEYKFTENVEATAGFDAYYGYNTSKDNAMDVYRDQFVPSFSWHEGERFKNFEEFAKKVDEKNQPTYVEMKHKFKKEDKDVIVLTPKASATFKLVDKKLELKTEGKVDVKFEGSRLPEYKETNAELKVGLKYMW